MSEESLSRALLLCLERSKQVVEPAGAAGVAALLEHPRAFEPPVVAVLSGGNIDPLLLAKVLRHGLAAAGRYLTFRCRLPDRPGALATLLTEVAGLGANVLDVVHERVTPGLHVDEVEVLLQVETRGPAHCDSVSSASSASPATSCCSAERLRSGRCVSWPPAARAVAGAGPGVARLDHHRPRGLVMQALPPPVPQQPQLVEQREQRRRRAGRRGQRVHGGAAAPPPRR